jgi:hypothetical protein
MTISDNWLLDRARKRKIALAQAKPGNAAAPKPLPPVDNLWRQLQKETKRQAKVYTDALGDPGAVTIDTPPDQIGVRVPDGRHLVLSVDRKTGKLSETFRNQAGATRVRRPIVNFNLTADGELAFNFGGLHAAASSLLRRMIS